LFNAGEMLGPRLLSEHNLWFYGELMREARNAIREQRYASFARDAVQAAEHVEAKTRFQHQRHNAATTHCFRVEGSIRLPEPSQK